MKEIIEKTSIIILVFLVLIVPDFYAQSCSWRNYIDLPSANITDGFFVNLNGGYAFASEAEKILDVNGSIEYGIAGFIAGIKVYTEKTFCLDLGYQIMDESGAFPSLAIGIENITNNKFVSPLGDSGMVDEIYSSRPPEIASAYLVATKGVGSNFEMTFGLGRGRFVGYGPRSQYLNFDAFSDEKHPDFMVGFFTGMKFSLPVGISFIIETDGRDANAGLGYESGIWKSTLGLDKFEHLFAGGESPLVNAPWVSLSLSINPVGGGGKKSKSTGTLRIALKDKSTGNPIEGKIIMSQGNVERTFDVSTTQKRVLQLEAGVYKITVFSAGYKMKTANIPIKAGSDMDFDISLAKVINPAVKQSMDLTKAAAIDYKYGRIKEAKQKLAEALTLYPNNKKAQKGLELIDKAFAENASSLKSKARARESAGDIKGAIELWQEVVAWEKDPSATQKHIQYLRDKLAAARRKPVRRTTTTKVTKKAPAKKKPSLSKQQITDLYTKGLSAYFDGNYKEAIKYFQQVLSADPSHAQAKRYLGEAKKH